MIPPIRTTDPPAALNELGDVRRRLSAIADPAALLEGVFAFAPIAIQIYEASGRCMVTNQAYRDLFGCEPPPEYNALKDDIAVEQGVLELIHRAFAGETVRIPAVWFDTRAPEQVAPGAGSRVAVEITAFPIFDRNGKVAHVAFVYKDVTRELLSQAERAELLERLQMQIDRMPIGCIVNDADFRFLHWNPAAERMFGFTDEEVRGKHPNETIVPPASRAYVDTIFRRLAAGEMTAHGEAENITKDGRIIHCEWQNTPLWKADGTFLGIMSMAQDITARKRNEEALRRSEESLRRSEANFRLLVECSPEVIFVHRRGVLAYVNAALLTLLGYERAEELVGRLVTEAVVHPDDRGVMDDHIRALDQPGPRGPALEVRCVRRDGSVIILEGVGFPIEFDGEPAAVVIARDTTERRIFDEQVQQAQKMEAIGRLAGGIAHDFNNMLSAILGFSEIIIGDLPPGDRTRKDLEEIIKAAERAAMLTRQLLSFSRKQILEPRVLDLNVQLREMENMLRRLIGEDIELTLLLAPNLGSVKADPTQLEQVVLNLVINARDAMPAGGRLSIATESAVLDEDYARLRFGVAPGLYAMLVVSDSGQGMSKSVQEHVFEPFFTTKEIGKGTGLGLATVFGIVKQSGGHIALYSEPGQGTTFKVYFPRTEESPDREVHSTLHPMELLGTETILLVEDEDAVRQFVYKALTRQGYTVLVASNGAQAAAIAEQHGGPIHLLLTDVVMPNMSGRVLADRLLPRHSNTRVIYMSGYTEDTIVRQGVLEDGANFLSKPLTLAAMLRKVRDVLDRPL